MPVTTYFSTINQAEFQNLMRNNRMKNILGKYYISENSPNQYAFRIFKSNNNQNVKNLFYMGKMISKNTKLYKQQLRELIPVLENIKKRQATNNIKKYWRKYKQRINSPSKRTLNNPTWKATFLRQAKSMKRKERQTHTQNRNKLPKLPRNFGTWYNSGNTYVRPDLKASFNKSTKTLTLNGRTYRGQNLNRMGLPKNWM